MIASLTLPDGREVVLSRTRRGYRLTVGRVRVPMECRSSTAPDALELGELISRVLPGEVTASLCMTCGRVYHLVAGGVKGMPLSHGYCGERCIPEWGQA